MKTAADDVRRFLEGPAVATLKGDEFAGLVGNGAIKRAVYDSYLHEVGKIEDMKKSGGLRSGSSDCSALSSTPGSVRSLAFSIFSVKEEAQ